MENNIEKRKLSFWSKIICSVQGIKHYEEVIRETAGKAILYLLLFALLLGAVGSVRGAVETNISISKFISAFNEKCPNFELKNGELTVDGDQPMNLSDDKDYYFVIDTTNSTNVDALNSYSNGMLILKDKMIIKQNSAEIRTYDFKSFQGLTINKNTVNSYLPFARIVLPCMFIWSFLGYFLGGLISALFLALFALIANAFFKTELKYGQLYKISIYALTTPMLINVILQILGIEHFSYYWLAYHIVAFAYVCFALNRLKKAKESTEISNIE